MTDDLKVKREEDTQIRERTATQCARFLSTLMLGEILDTGPDSHVLAVPGGWIFYHKGITSTFVPQPPGKINKIILPK